MGTIDIKQWLVLGEKEERFLIKDIADHGCEGGVGGLIYYWETTAFHDEHEKEIWDVVQRFAEDARLSHPHESDCVSGCRWSKLRTDCT